MVLAENWTIFILIKTASILILSKDQDYYFLHFKIARPVKAFKMVEDPRPKHFRLIWTLVKNCPFSTQLKKVKKVNKNSSLPDRTQEHQLLNLCTQIYIYRRFNNINKLMIMMMVKHNGFNWISSNCHSFYPHKQHSTVVFVQ
jgi:hypothetical protein